MDIENIKLTAEEFEAFKGLEESYIEMEKNIIPPKCHFTNMTWAEGDVGDPYGWECEHCGHTKEVGGPTHEY